MDEVQRFIANNQHQFGYIMQEASRQWVAKDPVGALTVGDCYSVVQKHGQYHELLERIEQLVNMKHVTTINDLIRAAHQNAIDKGWYEEPRTFGEMVALMHSELSEALEDYRNGRGFTEVRLEGDKPCGIPTELADVVIRIFDACGHLDIDLEKAIREKMAYNATRPIRHGGKVL